MKTKLIFATALLSTLTFAKTFTYRLSHVPYQEIESCMSQAKLLAAKMESQAAVTISNVQCEAAEYTQTISILIDYTADKELSSVSTEPNPFKTTYHGIYKTLAECQEALPSEESLFQKETGLPIFTSYCFSETQSNAGPYGFRIDALGDAKRKPQYMSLYSDSKAITPTAQTIANTAKAYFAERNANLVHVNFRTAMPENTITLFYYADTELVFSHETLYSQPNTEICSQELNLLLEKLSREGITMPIAYCGSPFTTNYTTDIMLFPEPGKFYTKKSLEKFKDYKTCFENRNVLLEKYQTAIGPKVITGVCQRDLSAREYRVTMFIKN